MPRVVLDCGFVGVRARHTTGWLSTGIAGGAVAWTHGPRLNPVAAGAQCTRHNAAFRRERQMANSRTFARAPRALTAQKLLLGFIAGFFAVLLFHQPVLALLDQIGFA